ncbi:MAG: site-specific integrase [Actinomycetota bacterium]
MAIGNLRGDRWSARDAETSAVRAARQSCMLDAPARRRLNRAMKLSPSTLTRADQLALLETAKDRPREALFVSLALGTGLRLAELVGLDLGDVYVAGGQPRVRIRLRAEIAKRGRVGDVFLPDALRPKLERFWAHKVASRECVDPTAALFCSQNRRRISKRRVQVLFRELQVQAGFDRLYPFHALRHTAITNVYRASKDLFLAQRFARHASPLTTVIYTHASDEDLLEGVRGLPC